jgi:hypothetical protein
MNTPPFPEQFETPSRPHVAPRRRPHVERAVGAERLIEDVGLQIH